MFTQIIHQLKVGDLPPHFLKAKQGYVVLLTVLILSSVTVAIATSLLLLGVDSARNSTVKIQSRQARFMADACGEEALEKIRENKNFIGVGSLALGGETCSYNVVSTGGNNRTISASSTVSDSVRKIKFTLDSLSPINITSWQEVMDF